MVERREQGDLLGYQFAHDQRQVGDRQHYRSNADRLRKVGGHASVDQVRLQPRAQQGARKDAGQRDADLHGGEEAVHILP